MNIQKFIQIVREIKKSKIDKKNKNRLKKLLKKNRVRVRINQIQIIIQEFKNKKYGLGRITITKVM